MTNAGRDAYYAAGGDSRYGGQPGDSGQAVTPGRSNDPNSPINIPTGFEYSGANYPSIQDLGSLKNPPVDAGYDEAPSPARYFVKQLRPGLKYWRVEFWDGRRGFRQRGRFDELHAATAQSTTDRRFKGQEILPLKVTEDTSHAPDGTVQTILYMWSVNVFGSLIIAPYNLFGATNFTPLFKESSSGTLSQLTYSKGSTHTTNGLANITINGINYLAVMKFAQPVELLSDVASTPTSAGSMHSSTQGTYAMMNTTIPDTSVLMLINGAIYAMAYNTAFGTAPTLVSQLPFPSGLAGYALGMHAIAGGDVRCWWNFQTKGGASFPGEWALGGYNSEPYPGKLFSTNQRGTDLQEFTFPMAYAPYTDFVRDGVLGVDAGQKRIVFTNGRQVKDLRPFRDRVPNSDTDLHITGFWIKNESDLYIEVNEIASNGSSPVAKVWREYYDWNADEWYSVNLKKTTASAGLVSYASGGSLPVSEATGNLWSRQGYVGTGTPSWLRQWQPPAGTNPYQYRRSAGAASSTGQVWDSPATSTNTTLTIPGCEGNVLTWHRMYYGGQIEEGSVAFAVGGTSVTDTTISQTETFNGPINAASRWRRRPYNRNRFRELIVSTTLTQGADTYKTPQAYHYAIEGLAYDDTATFEKWSNGGVTWG